MSGTPFDEGAVVDSPTEWVNSHIQSYVSADWAAGQELEFADGVPLLLLTVLGRRSGVWRRSALIYGEGGGSYVIVASKGGAPQHPAWYVNLVAEPTVHVQVKEAKFTARARTAEGGERAALWAEMAEIWPAYNEYQTKTAREIPVVVLDPMEG